MSILDSVEPDAYIDWEFNEATINRIDDQYQPYYSRETVESLLEAQRAEIRKQVLLEVAEKFAAWQSQRKERKSE